MRPLDRDSARPHLSQMIRKNGSEHTIKLFGITDEGVYLGELEGGPFVTYEWLAANCVWDDTRQPCDRA